MLLPAYVDAYSNHEDYYAFLLSSAFTFFVSGVLILANKQAKMVLSLRQAFLLVPLAWVTVAAFCALPLYYAEVNLRYTQAYFEAVSGLTTTGATVMVGLDNAPPGVLLWRALLQWVGGLGIISMGILILPMLGVGGMQFFKGDTGESSEKVLPRVSQVGYAIATIYLILSVACAILYWAFGMTAFDAICHSMSTLGTAGLMNYDSSFGYYNSPALETICIIFMFAGGLPFLAYYKASKNGISSFWKDSQIRFFFYMLFGAILTITGWLWLVQPERPELYVNGDFSVLQALRYTAFNLTSLMTTTGFTTIDYGLWGSFVIVIFLICTFIGGCTGSSSGGLKVFRVQVLYQIAKAQMNRLVNPHGVFKAQYNHKNMPDTIVGSVLSFSFLFVCTLMLVIVMLTATGIDFLTAVSTAVATLSNAGPGFGHIAGPVGNYSSFNDIQVSLYSLSMLVGRVEVFVFFVLFNKHFWRN